MNSFDPSKFTGPIDNSAGSWVNDPTVSWTNSVNGNLHFATGSTDMNTITLTYNEYLDWLPKSSIWKKYLPIWHLKESYKIA